MLMERGAVSTRDKIELASFPHEIQYVADEPQCADVLTVQDTLIPGGWPDPSGLEREAAR